MKRFALAALMLAAATASAWAGRLEDIQTAGTLRVGISLTGEPIGFRDGANEPAGYDVEVARQLADALKVKLGIVEVTSAARITMLQGGQIDVVIANMTANVERAKAIDFSIPYLRTGMKLLVRGESGIKTAADLKGHSVVVGRGTTGEAFVKSTAPDAKLVYIDSFAPQAILQLRQGRADAAIEDSTLVDYAAKQNPGLIALSESYSSDPIAIGTAKGDLEFVRFLDMFVSRYVNSGAYDANYTKWFGQPGPKLFGAW